MIQENLKSARLTQDTSPRCGMIFSQIEKAINDVPPSAEQQNVPLETDARIEPILTKLEAAPPTTLKRKRNDDTPEDFRQFRRIRFSTSGYTEEPPTSLGPNISATLWEQDQNEEKHQKQRKAEEERRRLEREERLEERRKYEELAERVEEWGKYEEQREKEREERRR
jgi:hypothetical protein